jgi:hypothetical protein
LALYGELVERVGDAAKSMKSVGAHVFKRGWYEQIGSGDMRGEYVDALFSVAAATGEALRVRGIANALLTATGGTVNAIHATGRVAAAKTVSGALNAIRATLEVAGTNPTPGGTLAALQLDSNVVTGATIPTAAFARVTDSGAVALPYLFNFDGQTVHANDPSAAMIAAHADHASTHMIRILINGTPYWLLATNSHA